MNARGMLISKVEAQEATLALRKLSNFPSESIIGQRALAMNHLFYNINVILFNILSPSPLKACSRACNSMAPLRP